MVSRPSHTPLAIIVADDQAGQRVERLVMRALGCSRSEARALCESGRVTLDGRRTQKGARAAAGNTLDIALPEAWVVPEPETALEVRLERADLVVVEKPAGMPSVPLAPAERGTLANALVARYPEMNGVGHSEREPGLIHRLDTQTSGLLLAARNSSSFEKLVSALKSGALEKRYLAVVENRGLMDRGEIDTPLEPDPRRNGRVLVAREGSKYRHAAHTRFRVLERGRFYALIELEAPRAFRHQVRVHLASIGLPIAGDALYEGPSADELGARHALHASTLSYAGADLPHFSVASPAPAVFIELVRSEREPAF